MKTFKLIRKEDISGVSGTGVVAEGVIFHDGQAVLSWFGRLHSVAIYPCIEDLIAVHGHGGSTVVSYDAPQFTPEFEQAFPELIEKVVR